MVIVFLGFITAGHPAEALTLAKKGQSKRFGWHGRYRMKTHSPILVCFLFHANPVLWKPIPTFHILFNLFILMVLVGSYTFPQWGRCQICAILRASFDTHIIAVSTAGPCIIVPWWSPKRRHGRITLETLETVDLAINATKYKSQLHI